MGKASRFSQNIAPSASSSQKCFIGYSTETSWHEDLLATCDEILPTFDLLPWYAEQHFTPNKILREKVLDMIENTHCCIYDISYWRKDDKSAWNIPRNVFIEFGIALALNRPILLLRHVSNQAQQVPLPLCLGGSNIPILTFSGAPTLRRQLQEHLAAWLTIPPERDWYSHYCLFGSRTCEYREVYPYVQWREQHGLSCHIADGNDPNRSDFRDITEDVLNQFDHLSFNYLNMLPLSKGYNFKLCSICQAVRSSSFAIYRITPYTLPDAYIAIGISLALEKQYSRDIPRVFLTATVDDVPSLLSGYDFRFVQNDYKLRDALVTAIPKVIQQTQEAQQTIHIPLRERPLPFIQSIPQPPERPQIEQHDEEIDDEIEEDIDGEDSDPLQDQLSDDSKVTRQTGAMPLSVSPQNLSSNYHTCVLSYATEDQAFAERLYEDLQKQGISCWFAPHDLKIGDKLRSKIYEAIQRRDLLLLILSEHSIKSAWVEGEVELAFERERESPEKLILFPIRLDDTVMQTNVAWASDIRRIRLIGDFRNWQDDAAYQRALQRLLRDLQS